MIFTAADRLAAKCNKLLPLLSLHFHNNGSNYNVFVFPVDNKKKTMPVLKSSKNSHSSPSMMANAACGPNSNIRWACICCSCSNARLSSAALRCASPTMRLTTSHTRCGFAMSLPLSAFFTVSGSISCFTLRYFKCDISPIDNQASTGHRFGKQETSHRSKRRCSRPSIRATLLNCSTLSKQPIAILPLHSNVSGQICFFRTNVINKFQFHIEPIRNKRTLKSVSVLRACITFTTFPFRS